LFLKKQLGICERKLKERSNFRYATLHYRMMEPIKIIHTDQYFLNGLLRNDGAVVKEIYTRFAGKVKGHILQNNGSEDDAADIFQEALIDIYQQARYKGLTLTCPFEPFLLLVCKRKWLKELKKRGRHRVTNETERLSDTGEDVFALAEQLQMQEDKAQLFLDMFQKLGERCREIINKCLGNKPQEEVADELGISYAYLRKKKSECTAELIKLIQSKQAS
jgi:RNA polymerase sigma factor (sigma-70 family)